MTGVGTTRSLAFSPGLVSVTFRALDIERIAMLARMARLASITWAGEAHVPPGDDASALEAKRLTGGAGLEVEAYGSYWRAGTASFGPVLWAAILLGASRIRVWAGQTGSRETSGAERRAVAHRIASAADRAAAEGISIHLEFHRNTLTDTAESAHGLLEEIDALRTVAQPRVMTYWQPRPGISADSARAEVAMLADRISAFHVFSWEADGTSLPLAQHREQWIGWLEQFRELAETAGNGGRHELQLEFVRNASVEAFQEDADELHTWVAELGAVE
ncbi:TIM barrel protein [Sinomonas sp. G460-2]|uniref:TIM barrel protein n=1 Tax=Sinomonas sp. G460-2 TaxID=3393464 RepID=UPI0039F0698D